MASSDLLGETNWDLYEASVLIAKNIQECKEWTKRVPTPDQHPNRYDDELSALRITVAFASWLRRFVDIVYSGMYNPFTCGLCNTCLLPSLSVRVLLHSLQSFNRMCIGDYFYNDCHDIKMLRHYIKADDKKGDNTKSNIIKNVVRKVAHNEYQQRCCQHQSKDVANDTLQDIECALTKVLEDKIDYILDMIVTLVVANTYQTTMGALTDDPYAVASKYDDSDYYAPEEAGLVVTRRLFDILEEMTKNATTILTEKRKEKIEEESKESDRPLRVI
jgi:hypothetical protein